MVPQWKCYEERNIRRIGTCFLLIVFGALAAYAAERIEIKVDFSEAEQALVIVAKHNSGKDITEADWNALFATEPYRRLKKRETAMHSDFTDDGFKKFILSPDLASG